MALNFKTNLANKTNYGGKRTAKVQYIVVHYTGNDGDTDENNGKYFGNNPNLGASAHYFVDDDSVTISVPEDYIAWHCGANTYKHPTCRNGNSIGVEICDDVKNGVVYPSAKTIANALELVEYLMQKHGVPKSNVIRHWDVTGKICPAYWCNSAANDAKWKTEFWNRLGGSVSCETVQNETVSSANKVVSSGSTGVLYRVQVGAFARKPNANAFAKTLKALGFETIVVKIGDKYKVQTGAFSEKSNANALIARLKSKGFDAFITTVGGASAAISKGSKVRVKQGAKTYTGQSLASYIYNRDHIVSEISGNRAVITYNGVIVAAVHIDNLTLA